MQPVARRGLIHFGKAHAGWGMAVLAIGRQQASLGHTIGRAVASRLGCRAVDATNVSTEALDFGAWLETRGADLEEHHPTLLERLHHQHRRSRALLQHAVASTAAADNVVIIGLASPVILRDIRHVLKVAVVASDEARTHRLITRTRADGHGALSPEDAMRMLQQSDRQRAEYLRYLFHSDWLDPLSHDLVINTSRISAETAVHQILRALECAELHATPAARQHLEDLALTSRREAELASTSEPPDDGVAGATWRWLR
jgi:cytidylate kinase